MPRDPYQQFDALTVPLCQSNLIEASAGTGKTYSIAILVLRLVLTGKPIREILMVTFTKAAVAELEARIRLFVRSAYACSNGSDIGDENIGRLVQEAIQQSSPEQVQQLLRDAVLLLDETSVLTIHSFCQQTLTEFAFETNQLFGMELMSDAGLVLNEALNEFWRRKVTVLPCEVLELLQPDDLRDNLLKMLKEHLGGKRYAPFEAGKDYALTETFLQEFLIPYQEKNTAAKAGKEALLQWLKENKALLDAGCDSNANAKKTFGALTGQPHSFLNTLQAKQGTGYVAKIFGPALAQLNAYLPLEEDCATLMAAVREQLQCLAIQEVTQFVALLKQRQHLMGFDDLISHLHRAVDSGRNEALLLALRKKYTAVFVDEFQDTDKLQYEIFNHVFGGGDTTLFYIGDPKQSIYAWRKADIFTYFQARDSVSRLYSMNCNYRSAPGLLTALNHFFLPRADFDTFHFQNSDHAIRYQPVEAPLSTRARTVRIGDGASEAPLTIYEAGGKPELSVAAVAQTFRLLQAGVLEMEDGTQQRVKPSDIGILVRSNKEGRELKALLARKGIPATMIDDAKILQSPEAGYLLYLLQAMVQPVRGLINRAVLSPFTGFTAAEVTNLPDDVLLHAFTRYRESWLVSGCYTAVLQFMRDFDVQERLLSSENGARILTNLYQLTELVHTTQVRKSLSLAETIAWLKRGMDGSSNEGDAFEQRIESDEEAVRIVTIHKSKGLEYLIVLAPFLSFTSRAGDFLSFRDPGTSEYCCLEAGKASEAQLQWYQEQTEQENRRLLYVALTRAKYQCYVFRPTNGYYNKSTLAYFMDNLGEPVPAGIAVCKEPPQMPEGQFRAARPKSHSLIRRVSDFKLQQPNWGILSFTALNARGTAAARRKATPADDAYEHFIFSELRRGARTGDLLHYILERVYFNDDARWNDVIENALKRHAPGKKEAWMPLLRQLLEHVLRTELNICGATFPLSEVLPSRRLPEFEFFFPVRPFEGAALEGLSDDLAPLTLKQFSGPLEGMMTGYLDLFFAHNGRYYVLDWKSNYLGSDVTDYNTEALKEVMASEGYHLQYHLYVLAAVRYLTTRLPDFDYERDFGGVVYLFLRGMRQGKDTGVFCCKPAWEKIREMEGVFGGKDLVEERAVVKGVELVEDVVVEF